MKNKVKHRTKGKTVLLVLLLAVLCVGGMELSACRMMDPALYERVTAPVRRVACLVWEEGCTAAHTAMSHLPKWPSKQPESETAPEETQLAGGPAVSTELENTEPAITELILRNGQEILTGGSLEIVYYNQSSMPWVDQPYGNDKIGGYGCGPTAMAMAVSSLTGQEVNPAQMADWAVQNGHWASGSGSRLSIVEDAATAYGLSAREFREFTPDALRRELSAGGIMVALMTRGHFTDGGHFILLRGTTLDGNILVADPNSTERSLVTWDAQLILNELSPRRINGAPLWVLSNPILQP